MARTPAVMLGQPAPAGAAGGGRGGRGRRALWNIGRAWLHAGACEGQGSPRVLERSEGAEGAARRRGGGGSAPGTTFVAAAAATVASAPWMAASSSSAARAKPRMLDIESRRSWEPCVGRRPYRALSSGEPLDREGHTALPQGQRWPLSAQQARRAAAASAALDLGFPGFARHIYIRRMPDRKHDTSAGAAENGRGRAQRAGAHERMIGVVKGEKRKGGGDDERDI